MFVLIAFNLSQDCMGTRGLYSSEQELKKGVDYWMTLSPDQTLAYEKWETNSPEDAISWDWGYIAPKANRHLLLAGGGEVPRSRRFGKNLISGKSI